MPIISFFPGGAGSGGGLALSAVSSIATVVSHGKAYFKWTDPDDLVVADSTLADFAGTLLVRKAGSAPTSRRDGTIVLDSKTRNAYQNTYFCDSGLTDGVTYYYKFFTYTTQDAYTDSAENLVEVTPVSVAPADVSALSVSAAGNGKATLRWTDPENTTQDGITTVVWGGSKVVYKKGSRPTGVDDGTLVLNSTTKNAYRSTGLTISGLENGATYYFAVFPYGTDAYGGAVNTNAGNIISGVPNRLTIANIPSQSGSLTYTGSAQTPSWSDYDSSKMTLSVTAQTNAGTYTATFTPRDDYMWSDGTTSAKSVGWTIGKAVGNLTLSKSSITLNSSTKSTTFTVARAGDGAISAVSSDTSVATVSVSGTTVTVSSVNDKTGAATITVKVAAGTNHTAPANQTCTVSCKFLPAVGTPLNDISWADIRRISDAGLASNYFSIGDRKAVALSGTVGSLSLSGTYYCYIIGIDHNSEKEGANRIHFQFGYSDADGGTHIAFIDDYNKDRKTGTWFNMNNTGGSAGGWNSSSMRTVICPAFKNTMPSDLQAVLKSTTKYTDNSDTSDHELASFVTATSDEVFLLSEYEVFAIKYYANSFESDYQAQYAWYSAGNEKSRYNHIDTSSAVAWWLRSPSSFYSKNFCYVTSKGAIEYLQASQTTGFAPAFCV